MLTEELNSTFLLIIEWGFVVAVIAAIIFVLYSIRRAPRMKTAFLWLAAHLGLTMIAYIVFFMGLSGGFNDPTVENVSDEIHFLLGVAGLIWLTGMLCLILSIQLLKDQFRAKNYTPIQSDKKEG
ncbi:hypothetical protein JMA_13680 [Jeotgalibacillus malaysiensis]|uniref:Uncharacterized protein n=1 Tax=Jeotgalibacillus malaysiensis TaxID=1508404 RepID=A0A0B5AK02_9BACL|nr:hypothetical protein [Jeotgalibacillus malaysiensis]AJD90685.1 hypothetical protein JMA_13680 [Jeotgalibacillus malaysiensis]